MFLDIHTSKIMVIKPYRIVEDIEECMDISKDTIQRSYTPLRLKVIQEKKTKQNKRNKQTNEQTNKKQKNI